MTITRLLVSTLTLVALAACATKPTTTVSSATSQQGPSPAAIPSDFQVSDLPCAVVNTTDGIQVSYTGESLYRGGAALPKEEGLACLEVLSDRLKTAPQAKWLVTVGGEDGFGFDPAKLAAKRRDLLQRFFSRKGIDIDGWEWQATGTTSTQLELALRKETTGSP